MLGNITATQNGTLNKEVFLLDTKTYTWISNFQTKQSVSSSSLSSSTFSSSSGTSPINSSIAPDSPSTNSLTGIIVAVSVVGFLIVIISGTVLVLKYRKYRKNNQDVIEIPGSSDVRFSHH